MTQTPRQTNKKSNHYIIIEEDIDFDNSNNKWPDRQEVYNVLKEFGWDTIESLIIAKEDMNHGVGIVFRIAIRVAEKKSLNTGRIKAKIEHLFPGRNWIFDRHVSKSGFGAIVRSASENDPDLIVRGIVRDLMHDNWSIKNLFLKPNTEWDPLHPVVIKQASKGKGASANLMEMQKAHKRLTTKLFPLRKIKDQYRGWQSEVVQAHNAYVEAKNQGLTGAQIYLWGDGRVFKSTFIKEHLFG